MSSLLRMRMHFLTGVSRELNRFFFSVHFFFFKFTKILQYVIISERKHIKPTLKVMTFAEASKGPGTRKGFDHY